MNDQPTNAQIYEGLLHLTEAVNTYARENDRRWDENDRRWDENDRRWDENERRWAENDRRWNESGTEFSSFGKRLANVEDGLNDVREGQRRLEGKADSLERSMNARFDRLETRVAAIETARSR